MKRNRRAKYDPYLEAVIAWSVCASLHRTFCKGRDPMFTTRQKDFAKHEADARTRMENRRDEAL